LPSHAYRIRSYLSYWLDAVDAHSLHSPFLYDLYTRVIIPAQKNAFPAFEHLRERLLSDQRTIKIKDYGAGGKTEGIIRDIARTSLAPLKKALLYNSLISYFNCQQILELGTSFGITTLYLAQPANTKVVTMEGSPETAEIASLTFEFAEARNIRLIQGNIDDKLDAVIAEFRRIDFVLLDANHRYEPALRYFKKILPKLHPGSVVVMDDIHYSVEMGKAWDEIRKHELVHTSVDLYQCGILFFDPSLNKQHVILQY